MFRPTDEELAEAAGLGIDATNMNGIKLREAIRKAKSSSQTVSIPRSLRQIAQDLGVEIEPTDRFEAIKRRLGQAIERGFAEKGIRPGVTVEFDKSHTVYGGLLVRVLDTKVYWHDGTPRVRVAIPSKPKLRSVTAHILLKFAQVAN